MHSRSLIVALILAGILLAASASAEPPKHQPKNLREVAPVWTDSTQLVGKVIYLDFFASWCTPCALSFPFMKELTREYADRGLQIIAIDLDKDSSEATAFLERMRPPFRVVNDPEGTLAKKYDLKAVPSSFLYGKDGTLREVHQGFVAADTSDIREGVLRLLEEKQKP